MISSTDTIRYRICLVKGLRCESWYQACPYWQFVSRFSPPREVRRFLQLDTFRENICQQLQEDTDPGDLLKS